MPIAVAFRTEFSKNYFRDAIFESLQGLDEGSVYMASGFFTNFPKKQSDKMPDYNLADALDGKKLFTFGIYDRTKFLYQYQLFRDHMVSAGIDIEARIVKEKHPGWHAKVFILWHGERPVFGCVGSSNSTGPAMSGQDPFGIWGKEAKFSVECETFFWVSDCPPIKTAMNYVFGNLTLHPKGCLIKVSDDNSNSEIANLLTCITNDLTNHSWDYLPPTPPSPTPKPKKAPKTKVAKTKATKTPGGV